MAGTRSRKSREASACSLRCGIPVRNSRLKDCLTLETMQDLILSCNALVCVTFGMESLGWNSNILSFNSIGSSECEGNFSRVTNKSQTR